MPDIGPAVAKSRLFWVTPPGTPNACRTLPLSAQVVAADGHTFERAAIEDWLRDHGTSPVTNLPLPEKRLVPNRALQAILLAAAVSPLSQPDAAPAPAECDELTVGSGED